MQPIPVDQLTPDQHDLIQAAIHGRGLAYAPLSHFRCGAAVRDESGAIHHGGNIETVDMTLTTHAEMCAINAMRMAGGKKLTALACALLAGNGYSFPCGLCRQKIREFSVDGNVPILCVSLATDTDIRAVHLATIDELFPYPFLPDCIA
jgi:cytidine deaminase